jgi:hypothetical protein
VSLTDSPTQKSLLDVYPEGTPFVIQNAWVEGVVPTQYGDRTMAKILVTPLGGGTPQEFAVWGSLCEQVQQVEEGELPGAFIVVKEGKRYLFKPGKVEAATGGGDPLAEAEEKAPAEAAEATAETTPETPADQQEKIDTESA